MHGNMTPGGFSGQDTERVSSPDFLLSPSRELKEKWECAVQMQAVNANEVVLS